MSVGFPKKARVKVDPAGWWGSKCRSRRRAGGWLGGAELQGASEKADSRAQASGAHTLTAPPGGKPDLARSRGALREPEAQGALQERDAWVLWTTEALVPESSVRSCSPDAYQASPKPRRRLAPHRVTVRRRLAQRPGQVFYIPIYNFIYVIFSLNDPSGSPPSSCACLDCSPPRLAVPRFLFALVQSSHFCGVL